MPVRSKRPGAAAPNSNRLRIIGGRWRGRKLAFPEVPGLRPTPDRIRETLFNWLSPVISGARCLDLFCGSGALSLEALSRGAGHATMIDLSTKVIRQLQQNLALLDCNNAQLIQADALSWLSAAARGPGNGYDIIFLDPPFRQQLLNQCCGEIADRALLNPGGLVYLEMEADAAPALPTSWKIHRQTKAGNVCCYLCKTE